MKILLPGKRPCVRHDFVVYRMVAKSSAKAGEMVDVILIPVQTNEEGSVKVCSRCEEVRDLL